MCRCVGQVCLRGFGGKGGGRNINAGQTRSTKERSCMYLRQAFKRKKQVSFLLDLPPKTSRISLLRAKECVAGNRKSRHSLDLGSTVCSWQPGWEQSHLSTRGTWTSVAAIYSSCQQGWRWLCLRQVLERDGNLRDKDLPVLIEVFGGSSSCAAFFFFVFTWETGKSVCHCTWVSSLCPGETRLFADEQQQGKNRNKQFSLSWKVAKASSLEAFKTWQDQALSGLVWPCSWPCLTL